MQLHDISNQQYLKKIIELIKSISTVFVDYLLNNYTAVNALPG